MIHEVILIAGKDKTILKSKRNNDSKKENMP